MATRSGDAIIAFALPEEKEEATPLGRVTAGIGVGWIELFDGETLNGWVQMNGAHTVRGRGRRNRRPDGREQRHMNSFLCSLRGVRRLRAGAGDDIDRITNSGDPGQQPGAAGAGNRPQLRPVPGRVYGPQVEIRRYLSGAADDGRALRGGARHGLAVVAGEDRCRVIPHFIDEGWNKLRIVADGPRIQTWVNGVILQDTSIGTASVSASTIQGVTTAQPMVMKWRNGFDR
jgi:quinoprotein glucose dehydrogenase